MSLFTGKVVIVTGSSNGIGRGTAILFAKQGAKVTITGRNGTSLEETKNLCVKAGASESELLLLVGDVADEGFLEKLVASTVDKFGKLDVLVNNAGGASFAHYGKSITDIPLEEFEQMMEVNVKAVIRLSRLAVPHLEKTRGAIVNVSGALLKLSPIPFVATAKAALDQITVQMAGSLIKKGIRVNSVNPGIINTNFAVAAGASPELMAKAVAAMAEKPIVPLGRIGEPEDIGKIKSFGESMPFSIVHTLKHDRIIVINDSSIFQIILFLADRSQSEFLVGHSVVADGGMGLKSGMFPDA